MRQKNIRVVPRLFKEEKEEEEKGPLYTLFAHVSNFPYNLVTTPCRVYNSETVQHIKNTD